MKSLFICFFVNVVLFQDGCLYKFIAERFIFIHACKGHLCFSCQVQCKLEAPCFTWPFKCCKFAERNDAVTPLLRTSRVQCLTSEEEQDKRWANHFSEILNQPAPENPPDIAPATEDLDINTDAPTR